MVRKKAPKPNQLGTAEQEAECWDMATLNAPTIEICDREEQSDLHADSPSTSKALISDAFAGCSSSSTDQDPKVEQSAISWDDSAKDPASCVFTVDSEDSGSTGDIVEVSVVKSLSSCLSSKSANKKSTKRVVFDVSDDDIY